MEENTQTPLETPTEPESTPVEKPTTEKTKSKNKKISLIALVLLLILGGGLGYWIISKNKAQPKTNSTQTTNPQSSTTTEEKPLTPFAIAYAHGDASKGPVSLFWRPFSGGDKTAAGDIGKNSYISYRDVSGSKVMFTTSESVESNSGTSIWYSKDAGKSYTKIFTADPPKSQSDYSQITSAKFSSDGTTIVFALLPKAGGKNTIKEIDPETKKATDLFSVEQAGVFIEGYNRPKKQLYYEKGCFNCDGNSFSTLLLHDVSNNSDTTIYNETGKYIHPVLSKDFTKVLRSVASGAGEFIGGGKPYVVDEYDIAKKSATTIATVNDDPAPQIGYRANDGAVYYTTGKSLYIVNSGKASVTFEATQPLMNVYYVESNNIVLSTGKFDDFTLNNYTIASKQSATILSGDANTDIFGITFN